MKIAKRIISFMMAMVIFASFFCYNAGAVGTRYVLYEYGDTFAREYFSDTSAYALVVIRDWAEEDNTTDLRSSTYANIEDYEELEDFYDVSVYVNLTVWLEDRTERQIADVGNVEPEEVTVDAFVRGSECLNDDSHFSIADFWSTHEVEITFTIDDQYGNVIDYYTENDGPIIAIRTID